MCEHFYSWSRSSRELTVEVTGGAGFEIGASTGVVLLVLLVGGTLGSACATDEGSKAGGDASAGLGAYLEEYMIIDVI
jgi:hypothetical protein